MRGSLPCPCQTQQSLMLINAKCPYTGVLLVPQPLAVSGDASRRLMVADARH